MANGQQIAEANFRRFTVWVASKTDEEFRNTVWRGQLSREEIAKECGFSKSALSQNPRIKNALNELELELRQRGVLPFLEGTAASAAGAQAKSSMTAAARTGADADRLRRLELENAGLKAEVAELKRLLSRFGILEEVLSASGRLPR